MAIEGSSSIEVASPATLERIAVALERLVDIQQRIVDHFVPRAQNIVGTPYISHELGCTTVWITEMVRNKMLPSSCVVPGTGNGKPWKFYRDRIDAWIKSR